MARSDSFSLAFRSIMDQWSTVKPTLPPAFFFKLPPSSFPQTLPPPSGHANLAHPFNIPHDWYNFLLKPQIPVTIALVYVTLATYLNSVNGRRKLKPWPFSQTAFFKIMVIIHNALLAVYSLWTFVGMVNAFGRSFYPPWQEYGLAGTVDSLCKVNGPRGYGASATYNETTSAWGIADHLFHLGADGLGPDSTDVGRLWNEGLAFYGWLFYLSKFYEVIDTFIILAKGRKSSLLQTYHHAGAMLCMWAGIRYMSPPIWMFVLVNSFIHTIMYSFYFFICLHIKVPVWFKKTLTTMQITQFVVGATYAFLHLFVKYRMPISVPYMYRFGSAVSAAPSAASSAMSTAVATVDGAAFLKKLLLRAAGREGLAENVLSDKRGQAASFDAVNAIRDFAGREELRYKTDAIWTHCIDTSGQAFAIWLNCVYLLPLTWLFARFFIKSYKKREERRRSSSTGQTALLSGRDAYKGVTRRLSEAFEDQQHGVEDDDDDVAVVNGAEIKKEIKKVASDSKKGMNNALDELKEKTDPLKAKAGNEMQNVVDKAKAVAEKAKANMPDLDTIESSATTAIQNTRETIGETVTSVTKQVRETTNSVVESLSQSTTTSKKEDKASDTNKNTKSEKSPEKQKAGEGKSDKTTGSPKQQKKSTEQRTPQLQSKESSHRSTNSQDFEDQQSSWIDVKDDAEEAVGSAVESIKSKAESLTKSTSADKDTSKGTERKSADKPQMGAESRQLPAEESESGFTTVDSRRGRKAKAKAEHEAHAKTGEGSGATGQSKGHHNDHQTPSHAHDHPSYAEVVAESAEPDSKSSEDSHNKSQGSKTGSTSQNTSQTSKVVNTAKSAAETVAEEVKTGANKVATTIESNMQSGEQASESASESRTQDNDPLWFEKLTTGIDSKTTTGPSKKDIDKIIDESEVVRDEVVDSAEGQKGSSGKEDKDESEDGA